MSNLGEVIAFPSEKERLARSVPAKLDRTMARALVEAGYMELKRYIELYGEELKRLPPR